MKRICTQERHTSQGAAHCHQPAPHDGADHIAVVEDADGQVWLVGWHGDYVDVRPAPALERPAA